MQKKIIIRINFIGSSFGSDTDPYQLDADPDPGGLNDTDPHHWLLG